MKIHCQYSKLEDIRSLKKHPRNRNKHSQDQIIRFSKILEFNGIRRPIRVSQRSGYITSGHGLLEACQLLGLKEVPVSYQDYESEDAEYADLTADNALALWSQLDLSQINSDIAEIGPFDLDMLGIKNFKVDVAEKEGEDDIPYKVDAKTKLGDLYQLGNHRLLCGDSTDILQVEMMMDGEKADITFTSPPYNAGKKGYEKGKSKYLNNDDCSDVKWFDLMNLFTSISLEYSKYSFINVQWLYSNKVKFIEWLNGYRDHLIQDIVWCKPTMPSINENCLNSDHEYIFVFNKENNNRKINLNKRFQGSLSSWFEQNRSNNKEYSDIHRATFNVSLPEKFIKDFGVKSVIDFFGGTGSTLIAAEKTNAKCFMMELDPHYCDVIVARWEKFSGGKAELLHYK